MKQAHHLREILCGRPLGSDRIGINARLFRSWQLLLKIGRHLHQALLVLRERLEHKLLRTYCGNGGAEGCAELDVVSPRRIQVENAFEGTGVFVPLS